MKTLDCDVLIAGGGMAGGAVAAGLAQMDYRVVLVDPAPAPVMVAAPRNLHEIDSRVSALSPASVNLLRTLGAWEAIPAPLRSGYRRMCVWDADGSGRIDFDAAELALPTLGHIVENSRVVFALRQALAATAATVLCETKVDGFAAEADNAIDVRLADGRRLRCQLLVGADGASSRIRELAAIACREQDCAQRAIVTTVRMERNHCATAWQRFLPTGPLAFLPLTQLGDERHCSIVWSADTARAEELLDLDETAFAAALAAGLEVKLGAVLELSERLSFPLTQRHAERYVRPGVALVADAAHTLHPLAGQGINLGLADVTVLLQEMMRARKRGLAPGNPAVLARYQRRRIAQNRIMQAAMRGFQTLFASSDMPLRLLRNVGMNMVGGAPPLKHRLMREALGL